jgi:hypothetical protein
MAAFVYVHQHKIKLYNINQSWSVVENNPIGDAKIIDAYNLRMKIYWHAIYNFGQSLYFVEDSGPKFDPDGYRQFIYVTKCLGTLKIEYSNFIMSHNSFRILVALSKEDYDLFHRVIRTHNWLKEGF